MNMKLVIGCVFIVAITFVAAAIGARASINAGEFYQSLDKPTWAPPSNVFGPVWTILYCSMAIAGCLVWCTPSTNKLTALGAYVVQLVLNSLWSWLFFHWKTGSWAFIEVLILAVAVLVNLILFWRIHRAAGALLIPYLLWVLFASCLTYQVWQLNPELL